MSEPVVVKGDDPELRDGGEGVLANVLVDEESTGAENLGFGWISFEPGSDAGPHTREVEEFLYILSGTATIEADGESYVLEEGDSIYLPAGLEHRHVNEGDEVLEQLYFFAPPGPIDGVREWPPV
jgi:quercetin dioxygenase-like cupin family protein